VSFWRAVEFNHPFEAGTLVHARCLEIIARHPNAQYVPSSGLSDHRVEERATITSAPISLIVPHLLDFGYACPGAIG
jgi:hypothetical protein